MALAAINVKKTARSANIHEQKRITLEKTPSTNGKPNKNNSADLERLPDAPLGRGAQRGIVRCSARGRIVQLGHDVYGRSPDLCRLRLRSHGLRQFLYGPPRTARRQQRKTGRQTGRYTGLDKRRKREYSFISCPSPLLSSPPSSFACLRTLPCASRNGFGCANAYRQRAKHAIKVKQKWFEKFQVFISSGSAWGVLRTLGFYIRRSLNYASQWKNVDL